jgi:hypothetical protein
MERLEQFLVYSDDTQRPIETVNLLVARNIPVTFAQPASAVISELEPEEEMVPPKRPIESKPAPKEEKPAAKEPEIRKAKAVRPIPVKKALPYSPGVKQYHSSPAPLPVRRAVPLQRFNQEGNGNG